MPTALPADTSVEARRVQVEIWRSMSPTEKAAVVDRLSAEVRALALAGIRQRHPEATYSEQQRYLAVLLHGPEVVEEAFGWSAATNGR